MEKTPPVSHDFNLFNKGRIGIVLEAIKKVHIQYNSLSWKDRYEIMYSYLGSIYQMPGGVHVAMFTFYIEMMGTDSQR
jgi:acyl-CoA oxidase